MNYQFSECQRLEPRTQFKGGRITETDVLTLAEAAKFASVHAGTEITPADFLRSAKRGEVVLRAIVHQTAKLQRIGGGVYCNAGQPTENTVPSGSILTLPISACGHLAATGRASWRTFDQLEMIDGILKRYTIAELMPEEPDFETTPDDCRVMGNAVHALADAFIETASASEAEPSNGSNAKRTTAFNDVLPYLQTVHRGGKFRTTDEFIRELVKLSGEVDSPFKKAARTDDAFYLKSGGKSVSHSVISDRMKDVR